MELDEAYRVARELMDREIENDGTRRFTITRAELRDKGWVLFFSSCAFLRSRSFLDAIGGDAAIVIDENGGVTMSRGSLEEMVGSPIHPGSAS